MLAGCPRVRGDFYGFLLERTRTVARHSEVQVGPHSDMPVMIMTGDPVTPGGPAGHTLWQCNP